MIRLIGGRSRTLRPTLACSTLALSLAWCSAPLAQQQPLPDCGNSIACLQERSKPSRRDGFALRLAMPTPASPLAPSAQMGQAKPNPDAMLGCDSPFKGMVRQEIGMVSQQVLAGRHEAAQKRYLELLRQVEGGKDAMAEAALLSNLGTLAALRGQFAQARERMQLALQRYRSLRTAKLTNPSTTGAARTMAALAQQMARYGIRPDQVDLNAAMAPLLDIESSLQIGAAASGEALVLLNLGNLSGLLGQFSEAENLLQQAGTALASGTPGSDTGDRERVVQAELAVLYEAAGQADKAAEQRRRAGSAPLGEGTLMALGYQLLPLTRSASPALSNEFTEDAERLRPSRQPVAAQLRMQADAVALERAGDLPAAAATYSRKAVLAAASGATELGYTALADLARIHATLDIPDLAILSAKRAVNAAQQLRGVLPTMDRQARQAYLATKKRTYTFLAQRLLQHGRLAEAEQALRLLKEDEGQQFIPGRTDPSRPRGSMAYTLAEAATLARYTALVEQTRELESQREALSCGPSSMVELLDDRSRQEQFRLTAAISMEEMLGPFEEQFAQGAQGEISKRAARVRAITAKRPAARTAQERNELIEYQQALRLLDEMVDGWAASLRGFVRDAPYFLQPPAASTLSKLNAQALRIDKLRERVKVYGAPVANEPAAPAMPAQAQGAFLMALNPGGVAHGDAWRIDRALERLDTERASLDAEVLAEARRVKRSGEPTFSPPDMVRLDTGRKLMDALPPGTVALYYLSTDQSLDILVVDREGRSHVRVPVGKAQLDGAIQAYRQILESRREPTVAAKALYDMLVAPISAALLKARASTVMLALDGHLRYLPFGALHDGKGWLAERYALALYTTAAPSALTSPPAARWRAAAFGSTLGGQGLSSLPFVRGELEAIVRDNALKTQGALPGVIKLDRSFTAEALRTTLRERQNVVHIASHFSFRPGDATDSFLLLGDGKRLNLTELSGNDYRFDQVDLVTLSACKTGLGGEDSFGQEVEGMGTLLQAQGAAAVLATLWSVDDGSTAAFMKSLYILREQRGLSRAEALRAVQLSFIRGSADTGAPAEESKRRGASRPGDSQTPPLVRADPARPWTHPYHWAPFILMGNWL